MATVGPDHHPRPLLDRPAAAVAPHPDDGAVLLDHAVDREPFTHVDPGVGGRPHEQVVEHHPRRCVGRLDPVLGRPQRAGEPERAEVDRVAADGRRAPVDHGVEHPPPAQRRHPGRVDEVGRQRVARERRPVDQQDPVTLAGEEHGGRRAATAGADHDGVVRFGHPPTMEPGVPARKEEARLAARLDPLVRTVGPLELLHVTGHRRRRRGPLHGRPDRPQRAGQAGGAGGARAAVSSSAR